MTHEASKASCKTEATARIGESTASSKLPCHFFDIHNTMVGDRTHEISRDTKGKGKSLYDLNQKIQMEDTIKHYPEFHIAQKRLFQQILQNHKQHNFPQSPCLSRPVYARKRQKTSYIALSSSRTAPWLRKSTLKQAHNSEMYSEVYT